MWILAQVLTEITGKSRYKPEFTWSNLWVSNLFRIYESIFWRKVGIRLETTTTWNSRTREVEYKFFTLEARLAAVEQQIRENLREIKRIRIHIPILLTPQGVPMYISPYLFAIGFDAATTETTQVSSPATYNHTVTGSNPYLFIGSENNTTANAISALTYNSVALAQVATEVKVTGDRYCQGWGLAGPSTGTNTVSVTFTTDITQGAASYSGVVGGLDNSSTTTTDGTNTFNIAIITIADNCWVVAAINNNSALASAGTGTTARVSQAFGGAVADNNAAKTPAGSVTLQMTTVSSANWGGVIASLSPTSAAATTTVSHLNTLLGVGR